MVTISALQKKEVFWKISSVNIIKSAENCKFGHIYREILNGKLLYQYPKSKLTRTLHKKNAWGNHQMLFVTQDLSK